jgi:polysaccharide chain length determinant protein (PEP-CTERM system associated)
VQQTFRFAELKAKSISEPESLLHLEKREPMTSFRVRTPAEYLMILWRRRYYLLVPFIIVSVTLGYIIYTLPNVYETSTLIIVDPPKISPIYVQPINQADITARLGTIRQQVTSRTGLKEIMDQHDLYQDLRNAKTPDEVVLEEMRKHIDVNIRSGSSGANAFTISFRGMQPETVQKVTAELAARFIKANSEEEGRRIDATTANLGERITDVKKRLEQIEAERLQHLAKHPDAVPGTEVSMVGQMNSLGILLQSQRASIDGLQNQIIASEQLLATLKAQSDEVDTPLSAGQIEGQLRARHAELEGQLRQLVSVYTDKHPEVKIARAQLDAINKELADLKGRNEQDKKDKVSSRRNSPQIANLDIQIAAAKREVTQKQNDLNRTYGDYTELQHRLRSTPLLTLEAQRIDRDYDTLRKEYDALVSQKENALFSAKVIKDFNGETFRMQDPAYLPEAPVFPKRGVFYPFSLMLGLLCGLVVAMAAEARYLFTIQDARDVAHYTRLPLLVTLPRLMTDGERQQRTALRATRLVGVVLLIAVAVPLLVKVIQYSKVLNVFTGTY